MSSNLSRMQKNTRTFVYDIIDCRIDNSIYNKISSIQIKKC